MVSFSPCTVIVPVVLTAIVRPSRFIALFAGKNDTAPSIAAVSETIRGMGKKRT
jgi:hypothetical protein